MERVDTRAPRWFMAAAIGAFLWEVFGCAMYVLHVTADPGTLAAEQQAMWDATPGWSVAAYAIAVWVGLAGALLLILRRRLAEPLLLVSLIAVIVQFASLVLVPEVREVTPAGAWTMPAVVIIVCALIWAFARHSKRRGWLR